MAKAKTKKTPKKERVKKEKKSNVYTVEKDGKMKDLSKSEIAIKQVRGVFERILPTGANMKRWMDDFCVWFLGFNRLGYVYVKLIDSNNVEREHLIKYQEKVRIKKRTYLLIEKFKTSGRYGMSTYYFYQESATPINMVGCNMDMSLADKASYFDELLANERLDAITTKGVLRGGLPGLPKGAIFIILIVVGFVIYYFAYGKKFMAL